MRWDSWVKGSMMPRRSSSPNVAIVVDSASDIAREAADVVLLEKSLGTVVDGIREGRIIFANILKYLRITLTSNFGNFYSVALASLFLPFVPLLPIQILLLDLLSDFPMIAIATDTVDGEELEKPKNYQVHTMVLMATLLGVVSSVFDFILFGALYRVSAETLQTAWFLLSLTTEVILIFSLRTRLPFFQAPRPPGRSSPSPSSSCWAGGCCPLFRWWRALSTSPCRHRRYSFLSLFWSWSISSPRKR